MASLFKDKSTLNALKVPLLAVTAVSLASCRAPTQWDGSFTSADVMTAIKASSKGPASASHIPVVFSLDNYSPVVAMDSPALSKVAAIEGAEAKTLYDKGLRSVVLRAWESRNPRDIPTDPPVWNFTNSGTMICESKDGKLREFTINFNPTASVEDLVVYRHNHVGLGAKTNRVDLKLHPRPLILKEAFYESINDRCDEIQKLTSPSQLDAEGKVINGQSASAASTTAPDGGKKAVVDQEIAYLENQAKFGSKVSGEDLMALTVAKEILSDAAGNSAGDFDDAQRKYLTVRDRVAPLPSSFLPNALLGLGVTAGLVGLAGLGIRKLRPKGES